MFRTIRAYFLMWKTRLKAFINIYIRGTQLTDKGLRQLKFLLKYSTGNFEPTTFEEVMFFNELTEDFAEYQVDVPDTELNIYTFANAYAAHLLEYTLNNEWDDVIEYLIGGNIHD